MAEIVEHFRGCHPEHDTAGEAPEGYQQQETEPCWHCATPTTRRCNCEWCLDFTDGVPNVLYHCKTCGRYWGQMHLRITELTFGA
jgi:hypothetical protein